MKLRGVDGPPTPAQIKLLQLLGRAYDEDVPVCCGGQTMWRGSDKTTAARHVAGALAYRGLVRLTPEGRYVLLTQRGRAFLAAL